MPPSSLRPPDVSLIIPVYNGGNAFELCIAKVAALAPPPGEVIVADDGSRDNSCRVAERAGARVVSTPRPRSGPAIARNQAAAHARGRILFFVDADVLLNQDAVGRVVDGFAGDPELAALYGSYDETPDAQNFVSLYKNLLHHFVHQDSSAKATSFWAGCGAIRRDVFLQLGGFSPSFRRPSIEDIELGYRLKKTGYRTRLVKSLQVKHLKHWTLWSLLETDVRDRALPWTSLILRDREFPADLNLKWSHRLSVLLVYALLLSLLLSPFVVWSLALAGSCLALVVVLNRRLYQFFAARRDWRFLTAAIPLHIFYYLYSGFAFALGLALWAARRPTKPTG